MKTEKQHKTGYKVWVYGKFFWHRTYEGAEKRAIEAHRHCHNVQIIELRTGKLVGGKPE